MSYHILFKGIHFVESFSAQRWNVYVGGNLLKIRNGKMKHAYNKDKTRSIILKRKLNGDVLLT